MSLGRTKRVLWVVVLLGVNAAIFAALPTLPSVPADKPFTFVVLGDNRGDSGGEQPDTFREIVRAVNEAGPDFVLNTGDMIYGLGANPAELRSQWRRYFDVIAQLHAPIFHVPGNHDIVDPASAAVYGELCGPTYYQFEFAGTRFIGLDTETIPGRLGQDQFRWLEQQLENAKRVFVFMHEPLFPTGPAVGMSLDRAPAERDKLHALFVKHRDRIKAVFEGHEHLYQFKERDGVPYYITGGAGANLYVAPELGGFHHYLLVRVQDQNVSIELKKVGPPTVPLASPMRVQPGNLLASWEDGLFWYTWDYTVEAQITREHASHGERGLRFSFDLAQNEWPVLLLPTIPEAVRKASALNIDLWVPDTLKGALTVTPGFEDNAKHEQPTVKLTAGWNTIHLALPTAQEQGTNPLRTVGWTLTSDDHSLRGAVVFDKLELESRAAPKKPEILEDFERPQLWRAFDESVVAELAPGVVTEGARAAKLQFDFAQSDKPALLAQLNPPWDLSVTPSIQVDVYVLAPTSKDLAIGLTLRAHETDYDAPAVALKAGWNKVKIDLGGAWLPAPVRAAAEQVRWSLTTTNSSTKGWIVLDNMRAR